MRRLTLAAFPILAVLALAACSGGGTDSATETQMGDVDTPEGTISDAIPNPDLLANPANTEFNGNAPAADAKPAGENAESEAAPAQGETGNGGATPAEAPAPEE